MQNAFFDLSPALREDLQIGLENLRGIGAAQARAELCAADLATLEAIARSLGLSLWAPSA